MATLIQRQLVVVTGKGGVGKTTIAAAVGLIASEQERRTIIVELGEQDRLGALFGVTVPVHGRPVRLAEGLSSISIDADRALLEWLQELGGRVPGRVLASSGTFQYFAAAAPGAKELVSMVQIDRLIGGRGRSRRQGGAYDLVVLDAPASGHALGMLSSPRTFGAIARVGAVAQQARRLEELLADPARSAYAAVAHPTDMAVTETLELRDGLRKELGRELDAVIANAMLPKRFTDRELEAIARLGDDGVVGAAKLAARSVHERARGQHNQLARLRRRGLLVHPVPFQFVPALDLACVRRIAAELRRRFDAAERKIDGAM